jgi:hypothetical protein
MTLKNAKIVVKNKGVKIISALLLSFLLVLSVSDLSVGKNIKKDAPIEMFSAYLGEKIFSLMEKYKIPGASIAYFFACRNERLFRQSSSA